VHRPILSLDEISTRTHIPVTTLRYYRATGTELGPSLFRLGRHVVAFEDDVELWIEQSAALECGAAS
jgi:hypothetical protein